MGERQEDLGDDAGASSVGTTVQEQTDVVGRVDFALAEQTAHIIGDAPGDDDLHSVNLARAYLALLAVVEAAQAIKDGTPFLNGTPGEDFGGKWIPFVEALAALDTQGTARSPSQDSQPVVERAKGET